MHTSAQAAKLGHDVCEDVASGSSQSSIVGPTIGPSVTIDQATIIIGGAEGAYCPSQR